MKRSRQMTAEELIAELSKDPAYIERHQSQARRREKQEALWIAAFKPYLEEIHLSGYQGHTLAEILANNAPLPSPIVRVLLKAVAEMQNPRDIEMVVRALATSGVAYDGTVLTAVFSRTDDESLKWACINTIATTSPTHIDEWLCELNEYWKQVLLRCRNSRTEK